MKYNVYVILGFLILSGITESAIAAITSVSVTPTSAKSGTIFKFTANLDAPLTTDNKVKIDLGKGLASMTGKNTSYSVSRAMYTIGKQTYKVGIYNALNVLQGKVSSGYYNIESVTPVSKPKLPTIDVINAFKENDFYVGFAITLSAPLPSKDYRVKIEADDKKINEDLSYEADSDFKNGTNYYMMSDGKDFYQHAYLGNGVNSALSGIYSVGIYDAKGNLVSNKRSGNFKAKSPKDNKAPILEFSVPNNAILNKSFIGKFASKDPDGDVYSVKITCGSPQTYIYKNITSYIQLNLNCIYPSDSSPYEVGKPWVETVTAYDTFSNKSEYSREVFVRSDRPKKINVSNKSYTKISNDGSELSDTAQLGNNPRDWGCTRDNSTGFVWEIKFDDDSFRSRYKSTDVESYKKAMNDAKVCGINSWKMPNLEQLNTLVYCSDGEYNPLGILPSYNKPSFICASTVTPIIMADGTPVLDIMKNPMYRTKVVVNTPTIDTIYFPDVEEGMEKFMSSTIDHSDTVHDGMVFSTHFGSSENNYSNSFMDESRNTFRLMGCQTGWHLNESDATNIYLGIVSTAGNKCVKDN
jgi:hypothetical protein